MTRLEIINAALIACGQTPVTSVEASKASRLCDKQFQLSLDPVLSAQPWDELKVHTSLTSIYTAGFYPSTITVSGAGDASWNKTFLFAGLGSNDYPQWSETGGLVAVKVILNTGAEWRATDAVGGTAYAVGGIDYNPPKTDWATVDGTAPAPVLEYNSVEDELFEYSHAFAIPNDFVRIVEENPFGFKYDRVLGQLFAEDNPFQFSYVRLPTSETLSGDWHALSYDDVAFDNLDITGKLRDILAYHILSRCVYGITGDHKDTQIFESMYQKNLTKIATTQAQQKRNTTIQVTEESSWSGSRL